MRSLLAALLISGGGGASLEPAAISLPAGAPVLQKPPKDAWVPYYLKAIDERAKVNGLPALRKTTLPKDDIEVRLWQGFEITMLQGFVLKRTSGRWKATQLLAHHKDYKAVNYKRELRTPKSGWGGWWNRMVRLDILTLPDAWELKDEVNMFDGMSYAVEVRRGSAYRIYHYSNPKHQKWPEAKRMIRIVDTIYEEFGLK